MSAIVITFACRHVAEYGGELTERPVCPVCSEPKIARIKAPAPTFRGAASGPLAVASPVRPINIPVMRYSTDG
jgi:hypothetical protein